MKKIVTYILATIIFVAVVASVSFVLDFISYYNSVSNNPTSSGIGFLMIGMWHGILLFGLSFVGIVCSTFLRILNSSNFFKIYSIVGIVLFVLGLAGAVYVFCL